MPNLLDLMPDDERKKSLERAKKRMERNKARKGQDVSPEIFLVAKAGTYWGWKAIRDIRRGFTVEPICDNRGKLVLDKNGNVAYKAVTLSLDEVMLLLEGADKVRYSQQIEKIHAGVVSNSFKSGSNSFDSALRPFAERAEVKE